MLWSYAGQAHHDLEVAENGEIFVLTRRAELVPRLNDEQPVLHDFITVLGPDGAERRHLSIVEGRTLEVRPDQTTVWEYRTPHRVGEHGKPVATLHEVIRLDPEFPLDWLSGGSG